MPSLDCSQIGTGSSNSPRSATSPLSILDDVREIRAVRRLIAQACSQKSRTLPWALGRLEDRV